MSEMYILKRLEILQDKLARAGCDGFFSLYPATNQYLTGFRGSTSAVIVTERDQFFFCDARYTEQVRSEVTGFTVEEMSGDLCVRVAERLQFVSCGAAAFEPDQLSVSALRKMEKNFTGLLKECPGLVSDMRCVKNEEEVEIIEQAQRIAESALENVLDDLEEGISERELAAKLEYQMKAQGGDGASFDTIVLFGARSSLPHGKPSDARLHEGDIVLIDFGCRYSGYCSDLTRTFVFDSIPDDWFVGVYQTVSGAQHAALETAKAGLTCRELDAVAREHIRAAGYGEFFGHGLGHGLGIEIHEAPRLNALSETVLEPGMVVTIEPGIYVPGKGGVRIEDVIEVTSDGCRILTHAPKPMVLTRG